MTDDGGGSGRGDGGTGPGRDGGEDSGHDRSGRDDHGSRGNLGRPLSSDAMPASVTCPFCDGEDTEQFSAFGSAVSVGQYYCHACKTVFEWMKWRGS